MPTQDSTKLIAFYFPQFHPIPENNRWWGHGFTDWVNVRKAKPLFPDHCQPRVPLDGRYYDLSDLRTIEWQVDLAKTYGLYGFCHYHYWFDGVQLLEKPTNLFLDAKHLDFPFCLAWANETWSRRWDGRNRNILQLQTHKPSKEKWKQHFSYLIRAWSDPRAIRINGKPVFLIYRPHQITQIGDMLDYWQTLARHSGLEGIYLIAMKQYEFPEPSDTYLQYFDAIVQFQPFEAMFSPAFRQVHFSSQMVDRFYSLILKCTPHSIQDLMVQLRTHFGRPTIHDYDQVWTQILINSVATGKQLIYPGAFVDWDNTARYGRRARIFRGASPARFEYWLAKLLEQVRQRPLEHQLVFINAWNEWAESAYLEPDSYHRYAYLEALKRAQGL